MENDQDTRNAIAAQADALGMESLTEEQQAILEKPKPAEPPEPPPATKVMPVIDTEPTPPDTHCPNCDSPGIRKGKLIICEVCDAAFRYTKEGPKVEELGPFDKLEKRVADLEGKEGAEAPAVPDEPSHASLLETYINTNEAPLKQTINDEDDGI